MPLTQPITESSQHPPQLSGTSQEPHYILYQLVSVVPDMHNVQHGALNLFAYANRISTRVETAFMVRLVITRPRDGIDKLRVHHNHATKPKHLAELESTTTMAADTLQLRAVAFSSVAMKDPAKRAAAWARAKAPGEMDDVEEPSASPERNDVVKEGIIKAHEGEPIQLCRLCIDRERKRLKRSWKVQDESEMSPENIRYLDENSPKAVKIIPKSAIESWKRPPSCTTSSAKQLFDAPSVRRSKTKGGKDDGGKSEKKGKPSPPPVEEGTIATDFQLRISCYCRHHKDPEGFQ